MLYSPRRRSGIWRKRATYSHSYVVSNRARIRDIWGFNVAEHSAGTLHANLKYSIQQTSIKSHFMRKI